MQLRKRAIAWSLAVAMLAIALPAWAENYQVLEQRLDSSGRGYTVLRVWGTHREMGKGIGRAFAKEIDAFLPELRSSPKYARATSSAAATLWPAYMEEEIAGIIEGVKAGVPNSSITVNDVKALNSFSDWGYSVACRSHASWGRYVASPVKTLATRRLDLDTPFALALHHVIYAFEPSDGSPRWVNVGWPGYISVVTGVNERGTSVSLHDFNSQMVSGSGLTFRSVASRRALTEPDAATMAGQLQQAQSILGSLKIATGSFINYYAPEGQAGVFTCASGSPCGAARRPQSSYLGGEAILTANAQTDGRSAPTGSEFMDSYYRQGGTKDLGSHFALMGTSGLHLLSVEHRGDGDMTLWFNGRGRGDRLELEWKDLFTGIPAPDAGTPLPDASNGAPDSGAQPPAQDSGISPSPSQPQADAGTATTDSGPRSVFDGVETAGCGTGMAPLPLFAAAALLAIFRKRAR